MTRETKALRDKYMMRAHDIGSNAIKLVNEFFNFGICDTVTYLYGIATCLDEYQWTLSDLDRALDAMGGAK